MRDLKNNICTHSYCSKCGRIIKGALAIGVCIACFTGNTLKMTNPTSEKFNELPPLNILIDGSAPTTTVTTNTVLYVPDNQIEQQEYRIDEPTFPAIVSKIKS